MAIDVSVIGKLTDAVEAVRNFVDKTAGADEKPPPSDAVPTDSPAIQAARNARVSYQKTTKWMLAAFAAVGVLIFGSLPFAAVADVELSWPNSLFLVGGLLLAVAGIVGAVIAVSLVNEPEDASLGELESDLKAVQKTDKNGFVFKDNKPVIAVPRLRVLWNPRLACRVELVNILHGEESAAHLGPHLVKVGQPTVTHLIRRLGQLEARHVDLAPEVAEKQILVAAYEKDPHAVEKLATTRESLAKKQGDLAEVDSELALFHGHRDLVLAEAAVMQLRGRFRLARRILAIAAVLTLFGGTGYALALPGATENKDQPTPAAAPPAAAPDPTYVTGLPATVVVHDGTKAARELPRDCVERELEAIWLGNDRVPTATGPFTAVITDEACTGEIRVGEGEGRFTLTR